MRPPGVRLGVKQFALGDWVDALGQPALHLNGNAPGLIRGQALAIGSDRVASDAPGSSWWVAVLHQEDLAAGGGDLEAETRQLRIKNDPILIRGCERVDRTFGQLDERLGRTSHDRSGNHMVSTRSAIRAK
jgi:hypothetical protein